MKLNHWLKDLTLTYTWTIARGSSNVSKVNLVKLTDAAGIVGLGEASPITRYGETVATVTAFLNKVDASKLSFEDVSGSMKYLDTVAPENMSAKCAINIALVDGAARLQQKAVYDYFGLGFRENNHVTSFSIGIDKPDVIRKKVKEAERFPILKLKVGVPGEVEILAALREISPTKTIRVDANEGWKTKEEALQRIEQLARDQHIQYIEQPMPASSAASDLAWLKARSPLPIFADESYHTAADVAHCAECFHGVNVKLVKTAGVTGGFEALRAARQAGLKTMIGCMIETSVLISAAAHLAELCDFMDVDGNILINNDPYVGVTAQNGVLSFAGAPEKLGLRVSERA